MASCVVCYGPIGERGAWKVAGPGPERLVHFDCHRLAFDRPPAQRGCPVCGRPVLGSSVPGASAVVRGFLLHASCAIYSAPSFKADVRAN